MCKALLQVGGVERLGSKKLFLSKTPKIYKVSDEFLHILVAHQGNRTGYNKPGRPVPAQLLVRALSKVYWGRGASDPLSFHTVTGNTAIQAIKAHIWLLQAGLGVK